MTLVAATVLAVLAAVALDARVARLGRREPTTEVASHLRRPAGRLLAPALAAALVAPLAWQADALRTVAAVVVAPTLVVASLVDAHVHRIPDVVTRPATIAGVAVCAAVCVREGSAGPAVVGGVVAAAGLGLAVLWPAALGAGDAKLIAALAPLATAWGTAAVVPAAALGLVLSGATSAAIILGRRIGRTERAREPIAAGPFIAVGAVAALHLLASG